MPEYYEGCESCLMPLGDGTCIATSGVCTECHDRLTPDILELERRMLDKDKPHYEPDPRD